MILCPGLRDTGGGNPVSGESSGRVKEGRLRGGGVAERPTSASCQIQLPEPALGKLINRLFISAVWRRPPKGVSSDGSLRSSVEARLFPAGGTPKGKAASWKGLVF